MEIFVTNLIQLEYILDFLIGANTARSKYHLTRPIRIDSYEPDGI